MYKEQTKSRAENSNSFKQIAVIGSGAIGNMTALQLAKLGHEVHIIDPLINQLIHTEEAINGSTASLGVLMGYIYKRSSGRGWSLRERTMALWQQWIDILNTQETPLKIDSPLLQIAKSKEEASLMGLISQKRKHLGVEFLSSKQVLNLGISLAKTNHGCLISYQDGRINPLELQQALYNALRKSKIQFIQETVIKLERKSSICNQKWLIHLSKSKSLLKDIVIICAALGSETLLNPLGHHRPIEPILGQVLDLQLKDKPSNWSNWPPVIVFDGINLIPKGMNNLLLGATLEPGTTVNTECLQELKSLRGNAPNWLKNSTIHTNWSGIRARPMNRPAPLLEKLEDGLILATGHYRNGILLAPATADWVSSTISKQNNQ